MKIIILFSSLILLLFMGCNSNNSSGKENKIDKLIIGFTAGDDPTVTSKNYQLIADYLQKELNIKVEFYMVDSYSAVIEAMKAKKVDIAYLGELSYVIAAARAKAESIVMIANKNGRGLTNSIMITSPKSGLKNMDDVKKRAKELTLAFADPASTSGHLYPRKYLKSAGLDPEKSFKSVVFSNSHAASIFSAVSAKVDVACTFLTMVDRLVIKNKIKREDFVILWQSEPYISTPICVRGSLPVELKERIKKAYLDLPAREPELWKKYKDVAYMVYSEDIRKDLTYVSCDDSLYNEIREIARQMPDFDFLQTKAK